MLRFLSLAAIAALSTAAYAQDGTVPARGADSTADIPKLTIGDKAPKPQLLKIVKGEFPEEFKKDNVYVIEFWATWCPPCRDSMPHLSELQKKYKDQGVKILGISDEDIEKVSTFIKSEKWPEKTQYTIAVDDEDKTSLAYMRAAGQSGIPTAFIVGKTGQVEWIGHPMTMDEPLAQVVAGDWDRAAAKAEFDKALAFEKEMQVAQQKMMQAFGSQDWDTMIKIMDDLKSKAPADMAPMIDMQKFQILLTMANKPELAYKVAEGIVDKHGDDPGMMNQIAWTIATAPGLEDRDLDVALSAARAGVKATEGKDANILDTLAVVLWEKGDKQEAIKTEQKAIDLSEDPDAKAEFEARLDEWEQEVSSTG